jgi:hypothetical protein
MSKGVSQLEHHSNHDDDEIILFQTWNVDRFGKTYHTIIREKKLEKKDTSIRNVSHLFLKI